MTRKTYQVTAQRDGDYWLLDVPAIGRATQSRRLDQADDMVRDLIAIMTDKPEDSFDIDLVVDLDPKLTRLISEVVVAKEEAARLQEAASAAQRQAIARLTRKGFTARDTGRLLGLTHQRVAQLRTEQQV